MTDAGALVRKCVWCGDVGEAGDTCRHKPYAPHGWPCGGPVRSGGIVAGRWCPLPNQPPPCGALTFADETHVACARPRGHDGQCEPRGPWCFPHPGGPATFPPGGPDAGPDVRRVVATIGGRPIAVVGPAYLTDAVTPADIAAMFGRPVDAAEVAPTVCPYCRAAGHSLTARPDAVHCNGCGRDFPPPK